jgi:integrase
LYGKGNLGHNPCDLVDAPRAVKKTMRTLTPVEVEKVLDAGKDSYYYPIVYTALSTGLRKAELSGLRWRDVDLDMCSISVSQVLYKRGGVAHFKEPKTAHSRRRVAMTPKLAIFLREYKSAREWFYIQCNKIMTPDTLVFTSYNGEPLNASVITHNFQRMTARAGIKGIRFHDLRHTFASLMLLRGAKPKVISEALGHASVGFTLDTYSHIISGMQEEAMALLDEVLPSGVSQKYDAEKVLTPI